MDQLLGRLFGGQDDDDRRRGRAQDFVSRYEQGPSYQGISDEEAYHNYRQVAGRLSPQEYEESAAEAFQRMSPQERMQFAQMLQQRGGGQFGGFQDDDPRQLARMTSQYRQQDPGGLASLFGGGGGGGGGMGDMLSNPLAKAALGGVAAIAMKRMMGGR
ncbi:MAG: hypothetical protein M3R02_22580 [Chloroflexota bacterium]|nr:hypothetical protein [Chloroflexota bacterium]